ncbi:hypothetical protein BV22DRAFT_1134820 [Leucogyrophana mollusca]|uniref:Uncharacterized protein n=1 Tax=Leucogyrophana mollusca TaxID=85980 RepID=A0ACB8AXX0_9AGAM|nr:hypothetical protein BV22DRAFT_1134820 [Leucogyrophana mollusca]
MSRVAITVGQDEDDDPGDDFMPVIDDAPLDSGAESDVAGSDPFVPQPRHHRSRSSEDDSQSKRARVDQVEDEEAPGRRQGGRFTEEFPSAVAAVVGTGKTVFETLQEAEIINGDTQWAPFRDEDEWELARFLMKNLGQNKIDEFLQLPIRIDALRTGPDWQCELIDIAGDQVRDDGKIKHEKVELWKRNPMECVKELIGNPSFRDLMSYTPERAYMDEAGLTRIFDEMWTGDWWWNTQAQLPAGATVAPVILSSEKTSLSQFRGDKKAWPVYLSIGNIAKDTRRQVSAHVTILIGYLPVTKLDCFKKNTRALASYRLFHRAMLILLQPLVEAGKNGVEMTCADSHVRRVHPILAAYIADHPEQCLIACCSESRCPRCLVEHNQRGEAVPSLLRDMQDSLKTLGRKKKNRRSNKFTSKGLRAVFNPFWKDLLHTDIFACITPDILHQLHKGVFKDHLVEWVTSITGEREIDARFKAMNGYPALRHFKKGISFVSQWTGSEHKEMQKVFIGLLAGSVQDKVLTVARAVIDFIYHAQFQTHTSTTLHGLQTALDTFHTHKDIIVELEVHEHFNIPKLHSMQHYVNTIQSLGSADGFNSEHLECLHIDYAKDGYRASNKRDFLEQMAIWLQRQEAIHHKTSYIAWRKSDLHYGQNSSNGSEEDIDDVDDELAGFTSLEVAESSTGNNMSSQQRYSLIPTAANAHLLTTKTIARSTQLRYHVAQTLPLRALPVATIELNYGADDFIPVLKTFMQDLSPLCPIILPTLLDCFDVYKQVVIDPSPSPVVSAARMKHKKEDLRNAEEFKLNDLRVAQVRVLFKLPPQYGCFPHPLAYIQWFTPMQRYDAISGMYIVSRSSRQHHCHAAIISVDRIVRNCHLIAKCGQEISTDWTTDNVLERAGSFFVNKYIDIDTFEMASH